MSVINDFPAAPRASTTTRRVSFGALRGRLAAVPRALVAGMVASKDYRHLNGMTDRQLRQLGLSRNDISKELHRRHFKGLDGLDSPTD